MSEKSVKDSVGYSVVVPAYNEEQSLSELADRIEAVFKGLGKGDSFEVLFVDDGSVDGTREVMRELSRERAYVRHIGFRVNQGKSLALMAGFCHTKGEIVFTMDSDLQDNPEDIPTLLAKLDEGYDVVSGLRERRTDGHVRAYGSRLFNWTVSKASGVDLSDFNCGFKVYRRRVLSRIYVFGQLHRYIPVLANEQGFLVGECMVTNSPRKFGESKFPAMRYGGLFDLLSILFTSRYGFRPMHFFGKIGLTLIIPSVLILMYLIAVHIFTGFGTVQPLAGRPLLLLSTLGLLIGINVFLTGFVCDLLLHHGMRRNLGSILEDLIDEEG
ncbi:MAG: glycosyltransferase family 2 protein [Pseudodesulfovibrio sp.]